MLSEIPAEISNAHETLWTRLAHAGSWWSGQERIWIAEETRRARTCEGCIALKKSLSPTTEAFDHGKQTGLSRIAVDTVHRIVSDQSRITSDYIEQACASEELTIYSYVEMIGIVVIVMCIDEFYHGLGIPLRDLPQLIAGAKDRYIPTGLSNDTGFVPMIARDAVGPAEGDLWRSQKVPNIMRALSAVPAAVRDIKLISTAHYMPPESAANLLRSGNRTLDRLQMELIATRVAMINQCFYCSSSHASMLQIIAHITRREFDLHILTGSTAPVQIEYAHELMALGEAVGSMDEDALAHARTALLKVSGPQELINAVAVASYFQGMVRVSEATGIPTEDSDNEKLNQLQQELGLYRFKSTQPA